MKRIIFFLFISITLLTIFRVDASSNSFPLLGKSIVLDAGHGGADSGAVSGNILEKNINLAISYKLKKELENAGAIVVLTRTSDADLSNKNAIYRKRSDFDNRLKIINYNQDLFISIHQNYYYDIKYYGPQVFYNSSKEENKKLAKIVQKNLNKDRIEKSLNSIYMLKNAKTTGILIECGFMSNKKELNMLISKEYQIKISQIITNSIIEYYNN